MIDWMLFDVPPVNIPFKCKHRHCRCEVAFARRLWHFIRKGSLSWHGVWVFVVSYDGTAQIIRPLWQLNAMGRGDWKPILTWIPIEYNLCRMTRNKGIVYTSTNTIHWRKIWWHISAPYMHDALCQHAT